MSSNVVSFPVPDIFKGASINESFGAAWYTFNNPADKEVALDLKTLRARSRALCRNDIAGGIIGNVVTNVIGTGLYLDVVLDARLLGISDTEASAWGRDTERRFSLWANSSDADIEARKIFPAIQQLAFRTLLMDGDAIALLTNIERMNSVSSLRVNMIDPSREDSPYTGDSRFITSGIQKDSNGCPIFFYVQTNQLLEGNLSYRKVPVFHQLLGLRNMVHSFIELRPGQTRGLPFITSVIAKLRKLEKYSDAELGAAVITSFFALAFRKQANNPKAPSFADIMGKAKAAPNERNIHLAPEQQIDLEAGEELEVIKSDRPNSGYGLFVDALFREIAISLNIPKEILVKEFGRSYSASRGAIGEAFKYFLELRNNFAAEFCQPIYERWLFEEVAEGRIKAPGFLNDSIIRRLWCSARWVGPAKGMLDENKEATAAEKRISIGISTKKKEAINYDGSRIEDVYAQRAREAALEEKLINGTEGDLDV